MGTDPGHHRIKPVAHDDATADEEAPQYLGFLASFAGLDNPTTNVKTREALGWEPTHIGWVEDVQTGHYIA